MATLQVTGSLDSTQGSVCNWKVAGVQDLYARVVVAVERRHGARAPSRDRVCRVGKPYPEVVRLDRNGRHAGVQDEGLITEDPSHIYYSSANCIGLQVALVPRRDEGCVRGVDDKQRELRVCRKIEHLNMHVLNRSQVAYRDPSVSCGTEAGNGAGGLDHAEDSAIACCRFRERNYPDRT